MNRLLGIFAVGAMLLASNLASATIIGDEVYLSCQQSSGSAHQLCEGNGALAATVSDEIEYPDYFNFENSLSIDVLANALRVDFDNGPYCGWFTCDGQGLLSFVLSDLDWLGTPNKMLTGLDVSTNMTGVQTDFTADSVSFALPETSVTSDMFLQIDFLTNAPASVIEPSSLMVFALAVFGLAARKLRNSKLRSNTQ
ncbi:hypothetical protein [Agarivorans albus]|uniref:PEP-CTERM protein-sorting domain-containing protein n=1 Tax=Agarivorans albus MKT 106 TaxID=1331007 RepID=R9PHB2_AGAAL|nr:hypothetical protein [Agarivorans albus]GAD00722.1 hypothetical protein AALB_0802 [Agarivorans albus MKT 106]